MTKNFLARFRKDENGASLVEYAVLIALISLALVIAVQGLGTTVSGVFDRMSTRTLANPAP